MVDNIVNELIEALPPLQGDRDVIVAGQQSVKDIMKEVLDSHDAFKPDYDCIADFFLMDVDPLRSLFQFCKDHLPYVAEDEMDQTSKSPIAILMLADTWGNDCKHYSGWIGGTIDAWNRAGYTNYDWCYRFASYDPFSSTKEHVFVVVNPGRNEIWLDPAPIENPDGIFIERSFNDRKAYPFYTTDKRPDMSLNRITGCCINPNYQAQTLGYIGLFNPQGDDAAYFSDFNTTVQSDPGVATYEVPPLTIVQPDPLTADPAVPTYDSSQLNSIEPVNFPYIADYPTITGEPAISLPATQTAVAVPAPTTIPVPAPNTGNSFSDFIKNHPVETILIGSAIVIGGIWLLKKEKKKGQKRA